MKIGWNLSGETEKRSLDTSSRYNIDASREWIPEKYMEGEAGEKKVKWDELITDVNSIIQRAPAVAYENEMDIILDETKIHGFSRKNGFPNRLELVFEPRPVYVEPDLEPGIIRLCGFSSYKDFAEVSFMAATSERIREKIYVKILL